MLYQLIYYSTALNTVNEAELYTLLVEARLVNENNAITGLLAFIEGLHNESVTPRFMQILEGSKDRVLFTFNKIKKDKRHENLCILYEGVVSIRSFADWSMKFEKINLNKYPELLDFFALEKYYSQDYLSSNPHPALLFLKKFNT